jgi:hypothetical protein
MDKLEDLFLARRAGRDPARAAQLDIFCGKPSSRGD